MFKLKKTKKNITTLFSFFLLTSCNIYSQKINVIQKISNSNFIILQNTEISKIINTYNNLHEKQIESFKIQLCNNENRYSAWKMKKKYEALFPDEFTEWVYDQPYFKVKTNYFTKKIDAQKKLDSIKHDFPNAFILKEFILLKEF